MSQKITALLLNGLITVFVSSCAVSEPSSIAYYQRFAGTYATDAKGLRYSSNDFRDRRPPWLGDLVHGVAPSYPYGERASRHQGKGFFRLTLDLKTGFVETVETTKSTGFKALDESVVAAFRKWRWQPNKWREIEIPVTFELKNNPALPSGAARLPADR